MNYYIIVEGAKSEQKIYPEWIKYTNPDLVQVDDIDDLSGNHYFLISGMGYPYYFKIIDDAILDMNDHNHIDYLVISVDSEDQTFLEKKKEIEDYIKDRISLDKVKIIIQHFCIETWALGNRVIQSRNTQDPRLREYQRYYNLVQNDPEELPDFPKYFYNRAQFAEDYLKRTLLSKYRNLGL